MRLRAGYPARHCSIRRIGDQATVPPLRPMPHPLNTIGHRRGTDRVTRNGEPPTLPFGGAADRGTDTEGNPSGAAPMAEIPVTRRPNRRPTARSCREKASLEIRGRGAGKNFEINP